MEHDEEYDALPRRDKLMLEQIRRKFASMPTIRTVDGRELKRDHTGDSRVWHVIATGQVEIEQDYSGKGYFRVTSTFPKATDPDITEMFYP